MNVFELGFVATPIVGAVVGAQHHAALGVGSFLGGVIGVAIGFVSYFVAIFLFAAAMSFLTGKPMFKPEADRKVDDA